MTRAPRSITWRRGRLRRTSSCMTSPTVTAGRTPRRGPPRPHAGATHHNANITGVANNQAPTANNDTATFNEDDGATSINVLANDTDPDAGDTKEVSAVGALSGSLPGGGTCSGASCGTATFAPGVNNNLSYN